MNTAGGACHVLYVTGALAGFAEATDRVDMKKWTVSLEDIDDRGKLREEPVDEEKALDATAEEQEQEEVEEIGHSIGITYADDEELRLGVKEEQRDEHRWELDPASADDYAARTHEHGEGPSDPVRHMNHHPLGGKHS
jgi:hypothetical protein